MRSKVALTDAQILELFASLGLEITIQDVVFTRDRIAAINRERKSWYNPGTPAPLLPLNLEIEGNIFALYGFTGCRKSRGQRRFELYVIDFGAVRACCMA